MGLTTKFSTNLYPKPTLAFMALYSLEFKTAKGNNSNNCKDNLLIRGQLTANQHTDQPLLKPTQMHKQVIPSSTSGSPNMTPTPYQREYQKPVLYLILKSMRLFPYTKF